MYVCHLPLKITQFPERYKRKEVYKNKLYFMHINQQNHCSFNRPPSSNIIIFCIRRKCVTNRTFTVGKVTHTNIHSYILCIWSNYKWYTTTLLYIRIFLFVLKQNKKTKEEKKWIKLLYIYKAKTSSRKNRQCCRARPKAHCLNRLYTTTTTKNPKTGKQKTKYESNHCHTMTKKNKQI